MEYGDKVKVENEISGGMEEAIVVFWELDIDDPSITYVYLKSEDPDDNDKIDPRVPEPFYKIIVITNK